LLSKKLKQSNGTNTKFRGHSYAFDIKKIQVQGHCNCKRSRFDFRIFHLFTLTNKVVIIKLLDQTKKNTVAHYKK
jgi:hypothetical protein